MSPPTGPIRVPIHTHEPQEQTVDPSSWFLQAKFAWAALVLIVGAAVWGTVWGTSLASRMGSMERLLVKIDRQMMVPSQFNEWGYELKAANPTMDLKVPRLPVKAADQYQGD